MFSLRSAEVALLAEPALQLIGLRLKMKQWERNSPTNLKSQEDNRSLAKTAYSSEEPFSYSTIHFRPFTSVFITIHLHPSIYVHSYMLNIVVHTFQQRTLFIMSTIYLWRFRLLCQKDIVKCVWLKCFWGIHFIFFQYLWEKNPPLLFLGGYVSKADAAIRYVHLQISTLNTKHQQQQIQSMPIWFPA